MIHEDDFPCLTCGAPVGQSVMMPELDGVAFSVDVLFAGGSLDRTWLEVRVCPECLASAAGNGRVILIRERSAEVPPPSISLWTGPARHRETGTRRRGTSHEQLLRDIAEDYRRAVSEGDPKPRVTLAAKYGYSTAHVGRLLMQARKPRNGQPPLLGPAAPGRAGESARLRAVAARS